MAWRLLIIDENNHYLKGLYENQIKSNDEKWLKQKYYELDSGFDLFVPKCPDSEDGNWRVQGKSTIFISLGIKLVKFSGTWDPNVDESKLEYSMPYVVHPRSSIWKKPLRLANSTGIIDAGYRGELGIALDNIKSEEFVIEKGWRLVQACSPDLSPFKVKITTSLNDTVRGEGGFGSTGQ